MALAQKGLAMHGAAYFAHLQTAGKGQRGRQWHSHPKLNIILSVLLDMKWLTVSSQFHLSIAIALAVHDFFSRYAGEKTTIKWPNDIYWNDRKAAGILIENRIQGDIWQWAVVGIGININQTTFDERLKNPVSLKQITGNTFDPITLSKELCLCLEQRFTQLKISGVNNLLQAYNAVLYKKDQPVTFQQGYARFSCTIKEVSHYGQLIIHGASKDSFTFGEVEWLIE